MFLAMLVAAAAVVHPLEDIRLTQMQMFQLQLPYRYQVSIAEIERNALGRWELQVRDYYCNDIERLEIAEEPRAAGPPTQLRRNLIRGHLVLGLDDVLSFPDDRYRHLDGFLLVADGEYLLVITDRVEKITVWPPSAPDP